ncbi:MAG: ester cyclase [Acidimicrobiia bacterium]
MSTERNKQLVDHFDAVLNTRDLGQLDELCMPDMINHTLAPGRPSGLAGTREFLSTAGRAWQTDRWREKVVVAEGDFVVQYGVREGTWPGGPFRGFDLPAGDYTRDFAAMYRLVDGRIAERWAVRDDLGMMVQLGGLQPNAGTDAPPAGTQPSTRGA